MKLGTTRTHDGKRCTVTERQLIRERLLKARSYAARVAKSAKRYEVRLRAEGRVKAYQEAVKLIGRGV